MKYLLTITLFLLPILALAQPEYQPIVGVPGYDGGDFGDLMTALYALAISIAALLAVIKIVIAGVKWMLTDVVTAKGEAKKDIYGALMGLLIVVGAVLILFVINPNILNVEIGIERIGSEIPEEPVDMDLYDNIADDIVTLTEGGITLEYVISPDAAATDAMAIYCAEIGGDFRTVTSGFWSWTISRYNVCVTDGTISTFYPYAADNNELGCTEAGGVYIAIPNDDPDVAFCAYTR